MSSPVYPKHINEDTANLLDLIAAKYDNRANTHTANARAAYHASRNAIREYEKYQAAADRALGEVRRLANLADTEADAATAAAEESAKECHTEYIKAGGNPAQAPLEAESAARVARQAAHAARIYAGRIGEILVYFTQRNGAAEAAPAAADLAALITGILNCDIRTLIFRKEDDGRITAEYGQAPTDDYAIYASGATVTEALNYLLVYMEERRS